MKEADCRFTAVMISFFFYKEDDCGELEINHSNATVYHLQYREQSLAQFCFSLSDMFSRVNH